MADVVLVGGRAVGQMLIDRIDGDPAWNIACIIDDGLQQEHLHGIPVRTFETYDLPCRLAFLALSKPADKRFYQARGEAIGLTFASYVDRFAAVGKSCKIGRGSIIFPFASLLIDGALGEFTTLSAYAAVGNNASVGNYSTLMNFASVRGANTGEDVVLATAAHVLAGATLGEGVWVGPGSLVRRPVPAHHFAGGNPARIRRRTDEAIEQPDGPGGG